MAARKQNKALEFHKILRYSFLTVFFLIKMRKEDFSITLAPTQKHCRAKRSMKIHLYNKFLCFNIKSMSSRHWCCAMIYILYKMWIGLAKWCRNQFAFTVKMDSFVAPLLESFKCKVMAIHWRFMDLNIACILMLHRLWFRYDISLATSWQCVFYSEMI